MALGRKKQPQGAENGGAVGVGGGFRQAEKALCIVKGHALFRGEGHADLLLINGCARVG